MWQRICGALAQFHQHRYEWEGLWCSSTVRLLSTQTRTNRLAPVHIRLSLNYRHVHYSFKGLPRSSLYTLLLWSYSKVWNGGSKYMQAYTMSRKYYLSWVPTAACVHYHQVCYCHILVLNITTTVDLLFLRGGLACRRWPTIHTSSLG